MVNLASLIVIGMTFTINLMLAEMMLILLPQITFVPKEYRIFAEEIALMLTLVDLSFTPLARMLFRWSNDFVKPSEDELIRLKHIMAPVFKGAGKNSEEFKIYVAEQKILNAYASGINEIAVTRPLLALSDYELRGILAHELGHLHYKDGVVLNIINAIKSITVISFKVLSVFNRILCLFARLPQVGLFFVVFSWMIVLFSYIVVILSVFPQKIGIILSRHQEYRVDSYATKIGFGDNLIAGLKRIDYVGKPNLWERLASFLKSTNPSTYDRIEKINIKKGNV